MLHQYRPFTVASLADLAHHDIRERRKAMYNADMVWLIVGRLSHGRFELQAPSQFALEVDGMRPADRDMRTGKQIIDELRAKLRSL